MGGRTPISFSMGVAERAVVDWKVVGDGANAADEAVRQATIAAASRVMVPDFVGKNTMMLEEE